MKIQISALKNKIKIWQLIVFSVALTALIIVWFVNRIYTMPDSSEFSETVPVEIQKGMTIQQIGDTLLAKGLIKSDNSFDFWVGTLGLDRSLKAGAFDVPKNLNTIQVIYFLTHARSKQIKVTLLEGWRKEEIARNLAAALAIDEQKFLQLTSDSKFIYSLNLMVDDLEGFLLPETYFFYWGMQEEDIIKILVENCLSIFHDSVQTQMDNLKLSRNEILTLASIIEGEAIYDDERNSISSVYHNRLKKKIKLQADPTIQYIIPGPPRRVLLSDLEIDSPYNTYLHYGLPPNPINNPGKRSILAAVFPLKTNYLYFVARGDGRHTFTNTAAEHAREKAKFDKVRREVYRQKKYKKSEE